MQESAIRNTRVEVVKESLRSVITAKVNSRGSKDAHFVCDLGDIVQKLEIWTSELPRVQPFYAVKCNDHPVVLSVLAQLGTGFECASMGEIKKILELEVPSRRIVYSLPCKQASHIEYAANHGVQFMAFDCAQELYKVKDLYPDAKMVVRIIPPFGDKTKPRSEVNFGCRPDNVAFLLQVARQLQIDVVGVSFHVGGSRFDPNAHCRAVVAARTVFDIAEVEGFHLNLLDIGGGFPGRKSDKFQFTEITSVLRPILDEYFPESMGVRIIAEPGTYFVASAFTLAVSVIGLRPSSNQDWASSALNANEDTTVAEETMYEYFVNDGMHGSFQCNYFHRLRLEPTLVHPEKYNDQPRQPSRIRGPTASEHDSIISGCQLPLLSLGDWLLFEDMGAYTMVLSAEFNGIPKPLCYFIIQEEYRRAILGN